MRNLGFLAEFLGFYFTLYSPRSGPRTIWEFWRVIGVYFILCSTQSGPCAIWDFWWSFLGCFSHYVVLGAGRAQFGNLGFLAEFLGFYFTLYSPQSGPRTIWDFCGIF